LSQAGPAAASFIPALLDFAGNTSDDYLRKDALRAAGAIQPALAQTNSDVAQVLVDDATARDLGSKLNNNTATIGDLLAAVRLPQYSIQAAAQLGDLGSEAAQSFPAHLQSLDGRDEVAREKIVEAIYRIDPQVQINRVDAQTIDRAIIEADMNLGAGGTNYADPVTSLIMQRRAYRTWWTRDEVVSYARKVSAMDPNIGHVCIDKVIEGDPSMRSPLLAGTMPSRRRGTG
jgi:hypothetical protein